MLEQITKLIQQEHILSHQSRGITIAVVPDAGAGEHFARNILQEIVDRKTIVYLSGGKTPQSLYEQLTQEEQLIPGAVGLVDERYGEKFHERSNERMMYETGFIRYLSFRDVPFYPILGKHTSREEAARQYDEQVRTNTARFPKSMALLGIGADGHTAGIPAMTTNVTLDSPNAMEKYDLVTSYHDMTGPYGERVTMTYTALALMDLLLVLVFGDEKKNALDRMLEPGNEAEIPARFYIRPEIAEKTLIITDQMI